MRSRDLGVRRHAFTLVEMTVAIGLAITLIAIAVPTFDTALSQGQDRQATSALTLTTVAARRVASLPGNHYNYPTAWLTASCVMLPWSSGCSSAPNPNPNALVLPTALSMTTGASSGPTNISVFTTTTGSPATEAVVFSVLSTSGACMVVVDNPNTAGGSLYGVVPSGSSPACAAATLAGSSYIGLITGTSGSPSVV